MKYKNNSIATFTEDFRERLAQTPLSKYTLSLELDSTLSRKCPDRLVHLTPYAIHRNSAPIALDLCNPEHSSKALTGFITAFQRTVIDALFAKVKTTQNEDVSYIGDNVVTVDATSGLVGDKLEEVHRNFELLNLPSNFAIGMTCYELRDLWELRDLHRSPLRFSYEDGKAKNFRGAEFIELPIDFIQSQNGVRRCFAIAKEAIEVHWIVEEEQKQPILRIGAVRIDGNHIQEIKTTL